MKWTILGSGGCAVIPKPLCNCHICREAREKGIPYSRSGPSAFLHDIGLLIDTPAEIAGQINRARLSRVNSITFTHLDPDHSEGFRIVEQIALDYRTWKAYPDKTIQVVIPEELEASLHSLNSQYGPLIEFFEQSGFIKIVTCAHSFCIGSVTINAIKVERPGRPVFIYVFEQEGRKVVYAPCDIRPFPEHRSEVHNADLFIVQPGMFEDGLKHGFSYPQEHISRKTLYTFPQTMALAKRIKAKKTLFVHLEEYWHRSYDDYHALEGRYPDISFSYDGMEIKV